MCAQRQWQQQLVQSLNPIKPLCSMINSSLFAESHDTDHRMHIIDFLISTFVTFRLLFNLISFDVYCVFGLFFVSALCVYFQFHCGYFIHSVDSVHSNINRMCALCSSLVFFFTPLSPTSSSYLMRPVFAHSIRKICLYWNWNAIGKFNGWSGVYFILLKRNASVTVNISGIVEKCVGAVFVRYTESLIDTMHSAASERWNEVLKNDMFNESILMALERWEIIHRLGFSLRATLKTRRAKKNWKRNIMTLPFQEEEKKMVGLVVFMFLSFVGR